VDADSGRFALSVRPAVVLPRRPATGRRRIIVWAAALGVIIAMALDTKVVRIDSAANLQPGAFSTATYGAAEFPKVQAAIEQRAVSAATLAAAIRKDPAAAAKQYGVPTGAGPEFSVKFTGVVGKGDLGTYDVAVAGVPKSVTIQVQSGPAIIGTDLRDAPGTISFGQFTNQIDYQNAGAALNTEMKKDVLAKIDAANLTGKTIAVVGAFSLSDPKAWVITPAKLDVR
jgi:predicted lipoprotein